jgi:rare lipoprotein A
VRINNAGPYWGNRLIDLSRGLADRLGVGGVSRVTVEVLAAPTAAEARYKRGRRYPPVAGFIGRVASVEEVRAHWDAGQVGSRTLLAAAPSTPAPVALAAAEIPFLPDPARTDSFPEPKLAAHRPGLIAPTPPAADQPADPAATPTTPAAAAFVASQSAPAPAADRVVREIKGAVAADLPIRPGTSAARLEQD